MRNIVIFGATSAIASEVAKCFASKGDQLFLVGRNEKRLNTIAEDLNVRGSGVVHSDCCDLNELENHQLMIEKIINRLGHIDVVLIAHGTLGDQKKCEENFEITYQELKTNFISVVSLLTVLANYFEKQKRGCIAVISSVAGDRGRQSNYIYGAAKGGLSIFLQGLRNRLHRANVAVLTIKPGFIDTPMTKYFKKGMLWVRPDKIAARIAKSIEQGRQEIYVPSFWRYIMLVIKLIPERLFCRLSL